MATVTLRDLYAAELHELANAEKQILAQATGVPEREWTIVRKDETPEPPRIEQYRER